MKKIDDKDFELTNLPIEAQDPEIKPEDFTLQDNDSSIHEQRFQTKPTTFFKDSMKRFAKNKSSVVAAGILGILILLAIFVPIVSPYDVSKPQDAALSNLEPKLFSNANGFWDGTEYLTHIALDSSTKLPDSEYYPIDGIKGGKNGIKVSDPEYTNIADKLGHDGYTLVGFYGQYNVDSVSLKSTNPFDYVTDLETKSFTLDLTEDFSLKLTKFEVCDLEMIQEYDGADKTLPQGFTLGRTYVSFNYYSLSEKKYVAVPLVDPEVTHTIGVEGGEEAVDIKQIIIDNTPDISPKRFNNFYFSIDVIPVEGTPADASVCGLVRNMVISDSHADFTPTEEVKENPYLNEVEYFAMDLYDDKGNDTNLSGISFDNPMSFVARRKEIGSGKDTRTNRGFWNAGSTREYTKQIYLGKCIFGSFTFDTYAAKLGVGYRPISVGDLQEWSKTKKWIYFEFDYDYDVKGKAYITELTLEVYPKYKDVCPIIEDLDGEEALSRVMSFKETDGKVDFNLYTKVYVYRYLGFDEMPSYLFGTDKAGRDMFKYVFEGLRNSLLLGVLTFVVCFLFGLLWGAISGYFGGSVDLAMERLTDILSGMPWVVVMTIIVMHMGRNFTAFAIALCLTGWIGTASTTRTQFYRFRGREYVLASRTLGASDARLIAKHILPNAMGTIITGAVLMIPSVIFSEATLAYLGLGFLDRSSLGVILSANQSQLFNHPYQLIFPSVIISLLMISFNLFGNGLRDAINPSLKGEGE